MEVGNLVEDARNIEASTSRVWELLIDVGPLASLIYRPPITKPSIYSSQTPKERYQSRLDGGIPMRGSTSEGGLSRGGDVGDRQARQ
jgi:hypothetical protein